MSDRSPPRFMFLVPNLITLSAMACGLVAVIVANESQAFGTAAALLLLGAILDSLDGRVARMTGTQSEFGVQLDSLSDAIAFGVAPALLMYTFAMRELGAVGLTVCCVYTACAIVRLARFNVHAAVPHDDGPGRFMVGLSVPVAAAILVALVGIDVTTDITLRGAAVTTELSIAMTALGALMVSTVPFRSFKDLRMDPSTIAIIAGIVLAIAAAWVIWTPAIALAGLLSVYLAQGFTELVRRTVSSDS